MLKILRPGSSPEVPPGSLTIGRATENDIVIPDVLASRHHATLIPTPGGTEIADNRSINGTFVNGDRVESTLLTDGDVVTIGNVDLVFTGGTLVRRNRSETATGTGGLDVRGVTWTIENNKTLLNDISLTARPGTLTAIIGPSGAGKSTLARLIAGYTHPTSGAVAFEGHNIHADYASLRSRIGMVPQDDVVHGQLTVNQALMYAAELRLPPDTTTEDRQQVVAEVLSELEMTQHAHDERQQRQKDKVAPIGDDQPGLPPNDRRELPTQAGVRGLTEVGWRLDRRRRRRGPGLRQIPIAGGLRITGDGAEDVGPVGCSHRRPDLGRRSAERGLATRREQQHLIAHIEVGQRMRHHQHDAAGVGEIPQHRHDLTIQRRVQTGRRFIEDQQ